MTDAESLTGPPCRHERCDCGPMPQQREATMTEPDATDDDLLAEYAVESEPGRWWLSSPAYTHSRDATLKLIRSCLWLGVRVTDVSTSDAWYALIQRVRALEEAAGQERVELPSTSDATRGDHVPGR